MSFVIETPIGRATHNGHEKQTLLELLLRLEGDIRRSLEPIRVTALQVGVKRYLHRRVDARLTDAAPPLRVRQPTLSDVVKDLVRKRWVTKRRSVTETCVVHLRLSRRGSCLAHQIEKRAHRVNAALAEQDRRALDMNPKVNRVKLEWPDVDMRRREFSLHKTKSGETPVVPMTLDVYAAFSDL